MLKRGEMSSQWLTFLVALIIVTAIVLFGYNSYSSISTQQCLVQQAGFEQQLRLDMDTALSNEDSSEKKSYVVPCGVEKLYFVDNGNIDPSDPFVQSVLETLPLIQDALEDATGKNLFFLSNGRVEKAATVGNVTLEFPYFKCFAASKGKVEMLIGEENGTAVLQHTEPKFNCGATTSLVTVNVEEAQDVFSKGLAPTDPEQGGNCEDDEGNTIGGVSDQDEIGSFLNQGCGTKKLKIHKEKVEALRAIRVDEKGTKVTLRFRVVQGEDIDDFIFLEYIPKVCVAGLKDPNEGMDEEEKGRHKSEQILNENGEFLTKDDPLLMWSFSKLGMEKKTVHYNLKKPLSTECQQFIKGISMSLEGNGVSG
ncbi:hypothetical protein HYU13_03315 [Candidatus Woesearchaeota archaeon]|nr:hypothetical protein [Candidatus Woesearchaeota archaeon]